MRTRNGRAAHIESADGVIVAYLPWQTIDKGASLADDGGAYANAHLIVAAPNLYAALKAVTAQLEAWLDGVEQPDTADVAAVATARAAIVKAGEGL